MNILGIHQGVARPRQAEPAADAQSAPKQVPEGFLDQWDRLKARNAGEDAYVELVFDRCHAMVFRVAHRITGSRWDAEDIVQSAFEVLARKLSTVRDPECVPSYLKTVVVRAALSHLKRGRFIKDRHRLIAALDAGREPRAEIPNPSVRRVFMRLPAEERTALLLKHVEGHTLREVAELMGCSVSTTRRRLASARDRMTTIIGAEATAKMLRELPKQG